jgi:hypothetical protein
LRGFLCSRERREKVPFILKEEILSQQQTKEKVLLILKKEILSQQQSKEKGECSPYPTGRNPLNNKQRRREKVR